MEELKYKVGDEVLIKGKVVDTGKPYDTSYPYKIVFDDDEIVTSWSDWFTMSSVVGMASDLVKSEDQKTYEQGLNDAWEMARIITAAESENGIPMDRLRDIYGSSDLDIIAKNYSALEAINIYEDWKEHNEIKMGDIVEYDVAGGTERAIFYSEGPQGWWLLSNENESPLYLCKEDFPLRKVGDSDLDISGTLDRIS